MRYPYLMHGADIQILEEEFFKLARKELSFEGMFHPDLLFFTPSGDLYDMEQIKLFRKEAYLSPYQAPFRILVLSRVDRMLPVHANALLKVLEEYPSTTSIYCLTEHIEALLPTVRSRLVSISVGKQKTAQSDLLDPLLLERLVKSLDSDSAFLETAQAVEEAIKEKKGEGHIEALLDFLESKVKHASCLQARSLFLQGYHANIRIKVLLESWVFSRAFSHLKIS